MLCPPLFSGETYSSKRFLPAYSPVEVPGLGNRLGVDLNQGLICMELWGPCIRVQVEEVGLGADKGQATPRVTSMSLSICR